MIKIRVCLRVVCVWVCVCGVCGGCVGVCVCVCVFSVQVDSFPLLQIKNLYFLHSVPGSLGAQNLTTPMENSL